MFSAATLAHPGLSFADPKKPLEHSTFEGKIIRSIKIEIRDIFEGSGLGWFYRTANSLKASTREEVIRRELLFKEGEPYDDFAVNETIRLLRALGYLREVVVKPTVDGEFVDLVITTQDTWTLIPQMSYSSGTGKSTKSIGLSENDLLGLGKRGEVLYEDDEGRQVIQGVWDDPRVWGSNYRLLAAYLDRTDGQRTVLSFGEPFRSLLDRQSWASNVDVADTVKRLFANGDERYIFRERQTNLSLRYAFLSGDPEISARRYSLGWDFVDERFKQATLQDYDDLSLNPAVVSNDPAQLAANRRYSGPVFAFERVKPDFISMNYIDRFERVEDYNLGEEYSFSTQFAPTFFGSRDSALLFSANKSFGRRFGDSAFLRSELGVATRWERNELQNTLMRGEVKYYNVLGPKWVSGLFVGRHTLAASFFLDYGHDLDKDREFLIGGDNALRGYRARAFTGDKRLAFNIEDRVHFVDDLFRLVSLGGAAFFDAGGATSESLGRLVTRKMYSDVGIGLRFAFPRSSGGRILRVDLAFPLRDAQDGSNGWELRVVFAGGQLFSSKLRSEALGQEQANVAIGFDR